MKQFYTLALALFAVSAFSQVRGTVTDEKGLPLPLVSILVENTYNGTSSNELGQYEINLSTPGKHTLIFQYLGFKTQKVILNIDKFPFEKNVKLIEENLSLSEVVINTKENPANAIIRSAIASRKQNSEKTARFKADFYSRGIFRLKNAPKKFMGVEIGDMDGALDSTGSGILYLSETVSKLQFEKPNNMKERIIASKVSGNDKGFSYNTARSTAYDFYGNTVSFSIPMISPIADNAFNYYKYKLEGTFQDESNQMINKIKVIAKRDKEPVFEGYLYIVEDSWAIYAVDLDIKGYRMEEEFIDTMKLVQNYSYNTANNIWAKNTQSLEFMAGIFGIKFNGKFSYVFSNYEFPDAFEKKTFSNEIVSFENNANKKDSVYWNQFRPIPLTEEENRDYIRKDSIYTIRNSDTYLDSIDKKHNRFRILDPITGYSYQNSKKGYRFNYDGLSNITSLGFNTVQGWNLSSGLSFTKSDKEDRAKYTTLSTTFNYGEAEDRLRVVGNFYHRFNRQNYASLNVSGGVKVNQFNPEEPISPLINSVSTLFFKDNYMKLYNKEFATISYGQDVANGINLSGKVEYSQRKPLVNNSDHVIIKEDSDFYTSNNPLDPFNDAPAFATHHLTKASVFARISFKNRYITRPDGKINLPSSKYPTLFLGYENAFAATDKSYEFQFASARLFYDLGLGNKGELAMNLKGGKFFNADDISFIDYKHFNGNQTHVGTGDRYLNVFNLLPYYTSSTNDSYFEAHLEYDDSGFIMNKIPLLNLLKANLKVGFHNLAIPDRSPYNEFTVGLDKLGFGKFRLFRVDYIRSYQNGYLGDGVIFGLKFLDFVD